MKSRNTLRYLTMVLAAVSCVGHPKAQAPASDRLTKNAAEFHRQARAITRGVDHSRATCEQALPLLENALDEQLRSLGSAAQAASIRIDLGRCLIALEDWASAAVHLRVALNGPPHPDKWSVAEARFLMASLYEKGLGVPRDTERALGLYLLSETHDSLVHRRDRAAAELILELNDTNVSPLVFDLLERQSASNWWRAIELRKGRNENRYELARKAVHAIRSISGLDPSSGDERAWKQINLAAGLGLLAWDGTERLPAAWFFLVRSGPDDEGRLGLQKLQERWPVRILNTDGSEWSMEDGAH